MKSEVVKLCCDLVAIASVNPQDKVDFDCSVYGEIAVAEYLAGWFEGHGISAEIIELESGRANVLIRLAGKDSSRRYMFCGHLDTVDVDGMECPFEPQVKDGRIYGRGSCDDKGPLAAICVAALDVYKSGDLPCDIDILASCGEEFNMMGAAAYSRAFGENLAGAVLAEPTGFDIIYAHKGVCRLSVCVSGVSVHSSMPEKGENALYGAAEVIMAIREFADIKLQAKPHPLLGNETVAPTIINGGQQINIIPDKCEIQIDWRTLPGISIEQCARELEEYLNIKVSSVISVSVMKSGAVAIESDPESEMIRKLSNSAGKVAGKGNVMVAGYATDGSALAHLSIPLAVTGPGSIAQAHRVDEYIEISQLELGVDVMKDFMLNL